MTSSTSLRVDYRDRDTPPSRWRLRVLAGLSSLVIAVVALYSLSGFVTRAGYVSSNFAGNAAPAPAPSLTPPVIDVTAQPVAAALPFDTIDVVVGRNDTLDRIFRRLDLKLTDLASIRLLPGIRQGLDLLKPGAAAELIELTYKDLSPADRTAVAAGAEGFLKRRR